MRSMTMGWGGFGTIRWAGRPAAAALAVGALWAGGAQALAGQNLELGFGVAQVTNPPEQMFDVDICAASRNWAGEGRLGWRLSPAASIEATGGYHWANGDQCAVQPEPIPSSGPFTTTSRETTGGFPYFSTDARLAFEPSSPSGPVWLRAFGGYGVIFGKDIRYWLAGGGLVFGGKLQSVFELEWNWFDIPFEETTLNYSDGVLVSSDTENGATGHSTFRLRAGFRWRP